MNVLAVDQARHGAWSVFDSVTRELIACDAFNFDSRKYTFPQAIAEIEDVIAAVAAQYDVGAIVIEDIQMRVNAKTFKNLAQLQGVLVNMCEKGGYRYHLVYPASWQSYCKARGRNSKEIKAKITELEQKKKDSKILSIQFVAQMFGIETTNDNLSDAVCIGWYAVNTFDF